MSSRRASSRSPFRPLSGASGSARGRSCPGSRAPRSCWRAWSASRSRADPFLMSGGATPLLPDTPHRSPAAVALLGSVAPVEPALEKRFLRRGLPEAEGLGGEGGDVAADREGGGRRPRGGG